MSEVDAVEQFVAKRKSQSCTSEDDVDNFDLTPIAEPLANPFLAPSNPFLATDPPKIADEVEQRPNAESQVPLQSDAGAKILPRSPQRGTSSNQDPVPSPFFPAGYSQSPPIAIQHSHKTPVANPLTSNSHNPAISPNQMSESQFAYRPKTPQAAVTPSPKPSFAAVVKSDPWAATAVSVTPSNFGASIRSGGNMNNAAQKANPHSFNRFDAEFGDASIDFPHQNNSFSQQPSSFSQQGPSFSQQGPSFSQHPVPSQPSNSFTPKLPKFSFASKPSPQNAAPSFSTPSFSQQKRKPPQDLTPNQNSFGKRPSQQTEGFEDEMPEGGTSGKSRWFQLSGKKRVTVEYWKGQPLVSIREYYLDNGVPKPGKKGVSLTIEQWVALKGLVSSVDNAVKELAGL